MRRLTIRSTLIGLFLLLGAALCLSVALQARDSLGEWRAAQGAARSNLAREEMARASVMVAQERTASYLALLRPGEVEVAALQERTDAILATTRRTLDRLGHADGLRDLRAVERGAAELRRVAQGGRGGIGPSARAALAAHVLAGYTDLVDRLLALRLMLLVEEQPADPETSAAFLMRRYLSLVIESLERDRAVLGGIVAGDAGEARAGLLDVVERNGQRAEMAVELLGDQGSALGSGSRARARAFEEAFAAYRRTEAALIGRLNAGDSPRQAAARWEGQSDRTVAAAVGFQETLSLRIEARLAAQQVGALRRALFWGGVFAAGVAAVAAGARTVLFRVIRPLETLRGSMMALAQGKLDAPLPETGERDELAAMADALRVFKVNALRRARLQEERLRLHERLAEAYGQLRADLESAAAVQESLIPPAGRIGGVSFRGRLRPSHGISGDTFDVLRPPNGAVHFFLIDVAGHGAAAALVSVASHYTVAQAIQRRLAGESLGETVAALNRDWPERMPYFTMVVGELRPEAGEGVLVQAGHPSPLLLHRGDGVEALGRGGLPIGVLPSAEWEEIRFPFRPGDRLMLFSDGLSEAESPGGEPFGEGRVVEALAERCGVGGEEILSVLAGRLRDWREVEELEDDMTLLLLEAVEG